eukprot:3503191-Prymnesium_polylepis.1
MWSLWAVTFLRSSMDAIWAAALTAARETDRKNAVQRPRQRQRASERASEHSERANSVSFWPLRPGKFGVGAS